MADRPEIYKRIRIAGALAYIPLAFGAGVFAGYFAGEYLVRVFSLPWIVMLVTVGIGALAGMGETIRVIKFVLREEGKK